MAQAILFKNLNCYEIRFFSDFYRKEAKWHGHCEFYESEAPRGGNMKIKCISCGRDVNLDHRVFEDYEGPVKCFSCSTMMEMRTVGGFVDSISPLQGLEQSTAGNSESRC
jgi:ribosomal protein S27E